MPKNLKPHKKIRYLLSKLLQSNHVKFSVIHVHDPSTLRLSNHNANLIDLWQITISNFFFGKYLLSMWRYDFELISLSLQY